MSQLRNTYWAHYDGNYSFVEIKPTTNTHYHYVCCDLDGTLIRTDTLWECIRKLALTKGWKLFAFPLWLLKGKAHVKMRLAQLTKLETVLLPYDHKVLDWLKSQHAMGKKLILTTGADQKIAQQIAKQVGLFSTVLASDGICNLTGKHKAQRLTQSFGAEGFAYLGDSKKDVPVWRSAQLAVLAPRGNKKAFKRHFLNGIHIQ